MRARITKLLLLSSGVLLSLSLAAQYPSNPAKSRLGYQTTGDGLIFRGAGAPAYSPGTLFNAWTYLDTTNMILYGYKNFSWVRLPSANNGLTMSGAYAQLGGSLNQNTTIESGTYNLKLGKTSGTNYAYMNTYSSGIRAGMYSIYGTIETDFAIGGGNYNLTSNDSDDTNQFTFTPTGFDFTYIGGSGVSRFRMDSAMFYMYGLPSFASHAAATTGIGSNGLYRLTDKRAIYVNNGNANDLEMPFDSITFTPGTVQPDTAELKYSSDLETLVFGADGTVIEIGQKEAWYVKNQTGSTIAKGTVVRASGTLGSSGRILVSPMVADGTVSSKYLLGITASSIANGADGYVIHFGKLRKTNTNSWNEGDVLYASATTPGALTNIEPAPPNLRLPIAFVVNKHAVNGVLAVRIQTGNELHELHDVDTSGINAGEGLVYNSTSHKWQASTGKLITTVDTAGMLANYPSTAGWGILKSTKTIRADSAKVASRFFVNSNFFPLQGGTLTGTGGAGFVGFPSQITAPGTPASGLNVYTQGSSFNWKGTDGYERQFASTLTGGRTYTLPNASGTFALGTGTATRIPIWTSANALGDSPALYNSTTKRWTWDSPSILELPMGTDAQRPTTPTTSDFWYNMTSGGVELYNGTRWAKVLEGTFNRGTSSRIPFFDANGQIAESNAVYNSTTKRWTWDSPSVIELPMGTDAQRPSPATTSDFWYSMTSGGLEWYNGTRWAKAVESTINAGTSTYVPYFDANGQLTQSSGFTFNNSSKILAINKSSPTYHLEIQSTGTINQKWIGLYNSAGFQQASFDSDGSGNGAVIVYNSSGTLQGKFSSGDISFLLGKIAFGAQVTGNSDFLVLRRQSDFGPVSGVFVSLGASGSGYPGVGYNVQFSTSNNTYTRKINDQCYFMDMGSGGRFSLKSAGAGASGSSITWNEDFSIVQSSRFVGIGQTNPQRKLDVNGEVRIADLTTDTPTRIVGADADGDLGAITVSTGLTLSAGVLTATGASTWLKTELEASRDVSIAGGSSTDFNIQNTRVQFDGKTKIGSDSSFVHDPSIDTTIVKGTTVFGKQSTLGRQGVSGYMATFRNAAASSTYLLVESGRTSPTGGEAGIRFLPSGIWASSLEFGSSTSKSLKFYNYNNSRAVLFLGSSGFVSGNSRTVIVGGSDDPTQWNGNGGLVVYDTITSGKALFLAKKVSSSSTPIAMFSSASNDRFTFDDNGTTRFHTYGSQIKEASDLSKTVGNIAAFATDGTMLDYRITRDTSTSNADFTVTSTLLSSCQELFISAEVTSGATDTVNIILPTPSATFKNNKVYVFGDDDSSTQWVAVKSANTTGLYYSNGGVKPTATNYAAVTATTGVSGVTYVWICTRRNSGTWNWVLIRQ